MEVDLAEVVARGAVFVAASYAAIAATEQARKLVAYLLRDGELSPLSRSTLESLFPEVAAQVEADEHGARGRAPDKPRRPEQPPTTPPHESFQIGTPAAAAAAATVASVSRPDQTQRTGSVQSSLRRAESNVTEMMAEARARHKSAEESAAGSLVWRGAERLAVVCWGAAFCLDLPPWLSWQLNAVGVAAVALRIVIPLASSSRVIALQALSSAEVQQDDSVRMGDTLGALLEITVWGLGAFVVSKLIGLDTGLGISGLIIAVSMQKSLDALAGTFAILVSRPFVVGERITLQSGEAGTVERINLRTTEVRLVNDGELLFVPNNDLANMRLKNRSRCDFRRLELKIEVDPATVPASKVQELRLAVERAVNSAPHLARVDRVCYMGVGAWGGFVLEAVAFVKGNETSHYREAKSVAMEATIAALEEMGVRLAGPTSVGLGSAMPPPTPNMDHRVV